MTYKLNFELKKIKSHVRITSPMELEFGNGEELCDYDFDKYYLIESISAKDSIIEITLVENTQINSINWAGEEAVSIFDGI